MMHVPFYRNSVIQFTNIRYTVYQNSVIQIDQMW